MDNLQLLPVPSSLKLVLGSILLLINKTKSQYSLPETFEGYTLVKEIKKEDHIPNAGIGVYLKNDKKYLLKFWKGNYKDLNYYYLVNEYNNSILLSQLLPENSNIKIPNIKEFIRDRNVYCVVFEYIEGIPGKDLPADEQAKTIESIINIMNSISINKEGSKSIPKRPLSQYIINLFIFGFLLCLKCPSRITLVIKTIYICFTLFPYLNTHVLYLAHRDLTPSNFIISEDKIYLLDCENIAFTLYGYDISYISVLLDSTYLSQHLAQSKHDKQNLFLQLYIALHHAIGSGNFFEIEESNIKFLEKKLYV